MSTDNEQLVEEFCAAWKTRDVDAILDYFTDDAVYHNIPLELFVPPADEIEFTIHLMMSDGDAVFTERTDRFVMGGKTIELPVAGVFELRDRKIVAWRDYFDMQSFTNQSA
jgi:limonene-1,2-epoxide hydrolase